MFGKKTDPNLQRLYVI